MKTDYEGTTNNSARLQPNRKFIGVSDYPTKDLFLQKLADFEPRLSLATEENANLIENKAIYAKHSKEVEDELKVLHLQLDNLKDEPERVDELLLKNADLLKTRIPEIQNSFEKLKSTTAPMNYSLDEILRRQKELDNLLNTKKAQIEESRKIEAEEKLQDQKNQANNDLISIINNGKDILKDAATIPQYYEDQQKRLDAAIPEAEKLGVDEAIIKEAKDVSQKVSTQWQNWLRFIELRDLANSKLDIYRQDLGSLSIESPISVDEGRKILMSTKVINIR